MSFMERELTGKELFAVCNDGEFFIPIEQLGITLPDENTPDYLENCKKLLGDFLPCGEVYSISVIKGYGARLSAPGFLDCTEWAVFTNKREAQKHFADIDPRAPFGRDE